MHQFGSKRSTEVTRGVPQTSIYPKHKSVLDKVPDYFIIQNKRGNELQILIKSNNQTLWSSPFQKTNKYYLPVPIKQQLSKGDYTWEIYHRDGEIKSSHVFTLL
jgi:hypothetical protein